MYLCICMHVYLCTLNKKLPYPLPMKSSLSSCHEEAHEPYKSLSTHMLESHKTLFKQKINPINAR